MFPAPIIQADADEVDTHPCNEVTLSREAIDSLY